MSKVQAFLNKYEKQKFEKNNDDIHNFMKRLGEQRYRFGKYKGQTLKYVYDVDRGYVAWVLHQKNKETYKFYKNQIKYYEWVIENTVESDSEAEPPQIDVSTDDDDDE
jgi:hypothetical protein